MTESFFLSPEDGGKRIEKICSLRFPGRSRSQWQRLLDTGHVLINGHRASRGDRPDSGLCVQLLQLPPPANEWTPAFTDPGLLPPVFSTHGIVVVEKPPGLPTLPLFPEDTPTAAGALLARYPSIVGNPPREAGIVNRLDNDTCGLLLAGFDPDVQQALRQRFSSHQIEKEYWALVPGSFPFEQKWVHGRILTRGTSRVDYEPGEGNAGQVAISLVKTLWRSNDYSLVSVTTRTGRRHQVRVQLASLGFPILHDLLYGRQNQIPITGHFLWARSIRFPDPGKTNRIIVDATRIPKSWLDFTKTCGCADWFHGIKPHWTF